ncbi:MAG: oxygen-independent coproporphyrinogen III oxidase-like protein [Thiotrichaceae bacterium]|nr:oxygen-independent coproporphyrinogen III oxidase-like protein [Thiotrichaceae bacterium]
MLNFTTLPPLSLYIHYPWCVQKCPYCDFNSHQLAVGKSSQSAKQSQDEQYVSALLRDLEHELPDIWGRSVQSIFIGGGTPSLIEPEQLHRLLSHIRSLVKLSPLAEITMEANPGTVDQNRFAEFHSAGVNRLSIGVQSFNSDLLEKIGRIHNAQQAAKAIEVAQLVGFDNINLDLMYGLPGQTLENAMADVQQAINFQTTHLSHYQLTLEPNTFFATHPPRLPDDDLSYDMQLGCQELLAAHGFHHYEVSAYAKENFQCRHNINYWQFGDYIGIGAGAHGKISNAQQQNIIRRWKEKHPYQYMEKSSMIGGENKLSRADIGFEFMLNASRLVAGFNSDLFAAQTGLAINNIEKGLHKAVELDLLQWQLHHIKPTQKGLQYLNELQQIFL